MILRFEPSIALHQRTVSEAWGFSRSYVPSSRFHESPLLASKTG